MDRTCSVMSGLLLITCVLGSSVGCRSLSRRQPWPLSYRVTRPGLVLHSDFPVPADDRLLDELAVERSAMTEALALPPSGKTVDIYLFETAAAFRRFIAQHYPEFPGRRAFFVAGDGRLAVYAHLGERVGEDLRHEMAHAYLHAVVPNAPLWLDEGIAECFEVPADRHGLNRLHLAELADALERSGWVPDLRRLASIESVAEMTQMDYAEAWAWVHLFLRTTSARRTALQGYLGSLRRGGEPTSLLAAAGSWPRPPERTLIRHLVSLTADGLDRPGRPAHVSQAGHP